MVVFTDITRIEALPEESSIHIAEMTAIKKIEDIRKEMKKQTKQKSRQ